jgi:hypothetical protein
MKKFNKLEAYRLFMKHLVKKRTCLPPHGTFYIHTHHSLSLNSVQSPRRKEKFVQKDNGERINL